MNRIIYFSGTGNTAYIAGLIESRLRENNSDVVSSPLEIAADFQPAPGDCLYIGFPVYGCEPPSAVRDFLYSLPEGRGAAAKIFCTKAWFSGKAAGRAAAILAGRGWDVVDSIEFVMPGSDGLAFLKKDGRAVKKLMSNFPGDFSAISSFVDNEGRPFKIGSTFDPGGRFFGFLMMAVEGGLKKKYHADSSCTRCGRCVSVCPSGNISMGENGIEFSDKCLMCMRCIHQCPVEAVQIGRSTVNKFRYKGPEGNYRPPKLRNPA